MSEESAEQAIDLPENVLSIYHKARGVNQIPGIHAMTLGDMCPEYRGELREATLPPPLFRMCSSPFGFMVYPGDGEERLGIQAFPLEFVILCSIRPLKIFECPGVEDHVIEGLDRSLITLGDRPDRWWWLVEIGAMSPQMITQRLPFLRWGLNAVAALKCQHVLWRDAKLDSASMIMEHWKPVAEAFAKYHNIFSRKKESPPSPPVRDEEPTLFNM